MPLLEINPRLEDRIAELVARHKAAAAGIDWSYHDYLPLDAYHARASHPRLSERAYVAVETALLTEVNLPWYTSALHEGMKGAPDSMREFVHVWTSEEDQHSLLLETYLLITDNGDHRARMGYRKQVVYKGYDHNLGGPVEAMAYTAIQEMATRAFYICTAEACEQEAPDLARALRRVAKDETLHMAFYRDVVKAHLDADPDYIEPLAKAIVEFEMPGYVLKDYRERSEYLARTDVFGPEHFYRQVLQVLWAYWELDRLLERLPPDRRLALRLEKYRSAMQKLAGRYQRQSAEAGRIALPPNSSFRRDDNRRCP